MLFGNSDKHLERRVRDIVRREGRVNASQLSIGLNASPKKIAKILKKVIGR